MIAGKSVLERIDRWADNLPASEAIPITRDEMYEFAESMSGLVYLLRWPQRAMTLEEILSSLEKGNFRYKEHEVRIL